MKKIDFHVYHDESSTNVGWPLTAAQVEHEYSTFSSMLAHYFTAPDIYAERKAQNPHDQGVFVTISGDKSEEELADALRSFLVKLNTMEVGNRSYHPAFIAKRIHAA